MLGDQGVPDLRLPDIPRARHSFIQWLRPKAVSKERYVIEAGRAGTGALAPTCQRGLCCPAGVGNAIGLLTGGSRRRLGLCRPAGPWGAACRGKGGGRKGGRRKGESRRREAMSVSASAMFCRYTMRAARPRNRFGIHDPGCAADGDPGLRCLTALR